MTKSPPWPIQGCNTEHFYLFSLEILLHFIKDYSFPNICWLCEICLLWAKQVNLLCRGIRDPNSTEQIQVFLKSLWQSTLFSPDRLYDSDWMLQQCFTCCLKSYHKYLPTVHSCAKLSWLLKYSSCVTSFSGVVLSYQIANLHSDMLWQFSVTKKWLLQCKNALFISSDADVGI